MINEAAAILRGGADYLEREGWIQGNFFVNDGESGAACAQGALEFVDSFRTSRAYFEAIAALIRTSSVDSVTTWNDDPTTTAELVIKTMRAAADGLDPPTTSHPNTSPLPTDQPSS